MVGRDTIGVYDDVNNRLMPVFCSDVSLDGNLTVNLILKFPFLEGSLGIGIPSPLTTSSYDGLMMVLTGTVRFLPSRVAICAV
jgi:hypothetical protein